MKQTFKKTSALLMVLTLVMSLFAGMTVAQADDPNPFITGTVGSITIHKYATLTQKGPTDTSASAGDNSTGLTQSQSNIGDGTSTYQPLKDASFVLYQVADGDALKAYYNGTSDNQYPLNDYAEGDHKLDSWNKERFVINGQNVWKTNASGEVTISNIPIGLYLLVEIEDEASLPQITSPLMEACLVSIPMVNSSTSQTDNNDWLYDIHVYPKNHEARGNVVLTKKNGATLIPDVQFELKKKTVDTEGNVSWVSVTNHDNQGTPIEYSAASLKTGNDGKITINDLPSGLTETTYGLFETIAPSGYIVDTKPITFTVHRNNTVTLDSTNTAQVTVGNDANGISSDGTKTLLVDVQNPQAGIHKTVKKKAATAYTKSDESFEQTETIYYQLELDVPANVASLQDFYVVDTPSAGVEDVLSTIAITGMTKDTHYTVTENTDNTKGFKLEFTPEGKSLLQGDANAYITYQAKLTDSAVYGSDGNKNNATLYYSSKITDNQGTSHPDLYQVTDEARVFSYKYVVTKTLDNPGATDIPAGVEFELYRKNDDNTYSRIYVVGTTNAGEYRMTDAVNSVEMSTVKIGTNPDKYGISILGLDTGKYYLKETKTVDGYNLLSDYFEIEVNTGRVTQWTSDADQAARTFVGGKKTVKDHTGTTYTNEVGTKNVLNRKGQVLPQTGSMGFLLFCVAGLVLVGVGAKMILGDRKRTIK